MLYRFVFHVFAPLIVLPLYRLFNRLEVTGLEHIPSSGPVVVIGNHLSMWDPVVLYCLIRREAWYMAKSEIIAVPILGAILRRIHVFPVRRDSADRAALRKGIQVLREGSVLVIYPEGTRSSTTELLPFKTGAAFIANRADAPVVPVLFENTRKSFPLAFRQHIRVSVGEPVDLSAYRGQKAGSAALAEMTERFKQSILQLKSRRA